MSRRYWALMSASLGVALATVQGTFATARAPENFPAQSVVDGNNRSHLFRKEINGRLTEQTTQPDKPDAGSGNVFLAESLSQLGLTKVGTFWVDDNQQTHPTPR